MKNRIVYTIGKIILSIGSFVGYIAQDVEDYGRDLRDRNCSCEKCDGE